MSPLAVGLGILGGVVTLGAALKAWPSVWQALCVFGKINDKLDKLDKLDAIEEAANEARDEWHGATEALNRLSDNYERRLSALEAWRRRVDQTP